MACHETKYCPRCSVPFECKVGNILQCQCNGVALNEADKAFIEEKYQDCLCKNCLVALKKENKFRFLKDKIQFILSIFKAR